MIFWIFSKLSPGRHIPNTSTLLLKSCSARCDPTNPAMPVIRTFIGNPNERMSFTCHSERADARPSGRSEESLMCLFSLFVTFYFIPFTLFPSSSWREGVLFPLPSGERRFLSGVRKLRFRCTSKLVHSFYKCFISFFTLSISASTIIWISCSKETSTFHPSFFRA